MRTVATTKPRTRREQREASRAAVLAAATDLFSRFGFEGTSLNTISNESGVSKQNLIYYFKTKEKLWEETVDSVFENVRSSFDDLLYSRKRIEDIRISELVRAYFEICRRHPAYVLIPLVEGVNDTWRSRFIATRHLRFRIEEIAVIARSCADRGEIKDIPPLYLQNLAAGGVQLFVALAPIWKHAIGVDTKDEAFITAYADTVVKLLRLGAQQSSNEIEAD